MGSGGARCKTSSGHPRRWIARNHVAANQPERLPNKASPRKRNITANATYRPKDGANEQDCEIYAGLRWLARIGGRSEIRQLRRVFLGDILFASQPFCDAVFAAAGYFILTVKPGKNNAVQERAANRVVQDLRRTTVGGKRKKWTPDHRRRWACDVAARTP